MKSGIFLFCVFLIPFFPGLLSAQAPARTQTPPAGTEKKETPASPSGAQSPVRIETGSSPEFPENGESLSGEPAAAGDEAVFDESSLFGSDEAGVEDAPEAGLEKPADDSLLKTEGVRWSGSFESELRASWIVKKEPLGIKSLQFPVILDGDLFFEARPKEDLRILGKLHLGMSKVLVPNPFSGASSSLTQLTFRPYEFFGDLVWKDKLFIRMGKQIMRWGPGYFWSPTDVLNASSVVSWSPEDSREGNLGLKIQIPFGSDSAFTLYGIYPAVTKPEEIGVSPKLDLGLGPVLLGIGGFYQQGKAPRLMAALKITTPIGLDIFSEAALGKGSDRRQIRLVSSPASVVAPGVSLESYQDDEKASFRGSLGLSFSKEWQNVFALRTIVQYYAQSDGYPRLLTFSRGGTTSSYSLPFVLGQAEKVSPKSVFFGYGRHYLGALLNFSKIGGKDISLGMTALLNLSDPSALLLPKLTFTLFKYLDLGIGSVFAFGAEGGEYSERAGMTGGEITRSGFWAPYASLKLKIQF